MTSEVLRLAKSLCERWSPESIEKIIRESASRRYKWIGPLAERIAVAFPDLGRPSVSKLANFLSRDRLFQKAIRRNKITWNELLDPIQMRPAKPEIALTKIPDIVSEIDLCEFLSISPRTLAWLINDKKRAGHYNFKLVPKRRAGFRLLEIPKAQLKSVQKLIKSQILDSIPVHFSAKGFRKRNSIQDYVRPHIASSCLLKLDLKDFFTSIDESKVAKLFWFLGFPPRVTATLTKLCTVFLDDESMASFCDSFNEKHVWRMSHGRSHLPQGASSSPVLANLVAYRLDARLAGLAEKCGLQYTRYADDLLFSGNESLQFRNSKFYHFVSSIILEEGFQVNYRKTRFLRNGHSQQVTGLVINEKMNTPRRDFERMKAILHDAEKVGFENANRENHPNFREHLRGKIQFILDVNPARGEKLMKRFSKIRD